MDGPEFSDLRNAYVRLRFTKRDQAKRRYWYRKIKQHREALLSSGVDAELLRLYCRWLADLGNRHAEARFKAYKRFKEAQCCFDF